MTTMSGMTPPPGWEQPNFTVVQQPEFRTVRLYGCDRCGLAVVHRKTHGDWHSSLAKEKALQTAFNLGDIPPSELTSDLLAIVEWAKEQLALAPKADPV